MEIDFRGKVAIVTGGAKGIGEATARKLADCGASVAILDADEEAGRRLAGQTGCTFFPCDVSVTAEIARAVEGAVAKFKRLDVVVSCAGIQDYGDAVATSEEAWDRLIDINLKGCFLVAKHSVPHIARSGGGAIVIVGSVQSFAALGNSVAYVASKHGLLGLARAMALDYAGKGIRVNCVCPGAIDTPMLRWAASRAPDPEAVIRTCDRMHALGRIGRPEEVANAIVFLASPMASFITGAALLVDGGMLVPAGGMGFSEGGPSAAKSK